jgi:hypothetical protein
MDRPYLMTPDDLSKYLPIATDSETILNRPERLKALGNAVVPQVAAIALQRVLELFNPANSACSSVQPPSDHLTDSFRSN